MALSKAMPSLLLVAVVLLPPSAWATPLEGVLQLDSLSFNKTLRGFPYSLVKFDVGYPTGAAHRLWAEVAEDMVNVPEIAVMEVRLKEYGDKQNRDLAERFNLKQEQLPEIILFKRKSRDLEETRYGAEMNKDDLMMFLKQKTGVYLNLPGCVRKYDSLARWFLRSEEGAERAKVIARTKTEVEREKDEETAEKGRKYLKLMQMVELKGEEALAAEAERVGRLLEQGKMKREKRMDMTATINIVKSFQRLKDPREDIPEESKEEDDESDDDSDDSDDEHDHHHEHQVDEL